MPPKVSRVLPSLPSSSLHPPLESIMRAGQPLWAVQAAVLALSGEAEPHCHHLTWWESSWQLCQRAGSRPSRTPARPLSITLRFASLPPDKPPDRKLTEGCLEHFLVAVYPLTLSQFLSWPQCSLADCGLAAGKVPWLTTFLCSQSWPRGLWLYE